MSTITMKLDLDRKASLSELRLGRRLRELEDRVLRGTEEALRARWEFGRRLLLEREEGKKKIPDGLMAQIVEEFDIGEREVQYRMRFAEACQGEDEFRTAMRNWKSWTQIKRNLLTEKRAPGAASKKVSVHRFMFKQWLKQLAEVAKDPFSLSDSEVQDLMRFQEEIENILDSRRLQNDEPGEAEGEK